MTTNNLSSRGGWTVWLLAAALLLVFAPGAYTQGGDGDAARKFIDRVGDDSLKYFADSIEESYPFGRSNKAHDKEIAKLGETQGATKDWKLFNRHYLFDGDWYAVEWFYSATTIKTGGKQVECTLAFGHVQDGKLVVWDEYFDDTIGELEQEGKLEYFTPDEPPFPWPAKATLKHPYRP